MTEGRIASGQQLFDAILTGQVPRQVRLFAAQGLLPVSREDLFRLQSLLSADPDPELSAAATQSLQSEDVQTLVEWIQHQPGLDPVVLDLLSRIRHEDPMWAAIAVHDGTSNETLRVLARHGSPLVQDIIITNQTRLLGHLELLEDLRANSRVSQVILRRVREFEEEFIEKAIAGELDEGGTAGVSIEEALAALRAIGAHIPDEQTMPYPTADDPAVREEAERLGLSTYGRMARLSVKEKIIVALRGSREERSILINSRSRLVVRAVLGSPKLTDMEVERIAASRSVSDEAIRIICGNRRWIQHYGVVQALTQNPKTPLQIALRLLPRLSVRDLARLSRDRNVNPVVRRRAGEFFSRRR